MLSFSWGTSLHRGLTFPHLSSAYRPHLRPYSSIFELGLLLKAYGVIGGGNWVINLKQFKNRYLRVRTNLKYTFGILEWILQVYAIIFRIWRWNGKHKVCRQKQEFM